MKNFLSSVAILSSASFLIACNNGKPDAYYWVSPKHVEYYSYESSDDITMNNTQPAFKKTTSRCTLYTHDRRGRIVFSLDIDNDTNAEDFLCEAKADSDVTERTEWGNFHYDGDWVSLAHEDSCTLERINQYGNPEITISTKNSRDDGSCIYENWYDANSYTVHTYDQGLYIQSVKEYIHPGADYNWDTVADNIAVESNYIDEYQWSADRKTLTVTTKRVTDTTVDDEQDSGYQQVEVITYRDELAEQISSIKLISTFYSAEYAEYYDNTTGRFVYLASGMWEANVAQSEVLYVYSGDSLVRSDHYSDGSFMTTEDPNSLINTLFEQSISGLEQNHTRSTFY